MDPGLRIVVAVPFLALFGTAVRLPPAWARACLGAGILVLPLAARQDPSPVRLRILEHLRILPGDHLRSIARTLRMSLGDLRYHLHVLVLKGMVREHRAAGRIRYYSAESGDMAERNALFQRHWEQRETRARVLNALKAHGRAAPSQVARTMGISRQLAAYHLSRLADARRVTRQDGIYCVPPTASGRGGLGASSLPRELER